MPRVVRAASLQPLRRQYPQEPAGHPQHLLAHHPPAPGGGEVELVLGPGDGHVEQPALLLEVAALDGAVAGELPVGGTDEKNDVVFKPLRLVDGGEAVSGVVIFLII